MSNILTFEAKKRVKVGKGSSRALRREERVPAIIYGAGSSPEPISLDGRELEKVMKSGRFMTSICSIEFDSKAVRTIPRDVHFDPVHDSVTHVDFLRLKEGARISVHIPLRFLNEGVSPGIKRGGLLNIVYHEVTLECPIDSIPDHLDVDLASLEMGHAVHMSDITLPDKAQLVGVEQDTTVVTVVSPTSTSAEESEETSASGE